MSTRAVLSSEEIAKSLIRVSHEIVESNGGTDNLILLGIPTRGVYLARRIAKLVQENFKSPITTGSIDVTPFRDDLQEQVERVVGVSDIPSSGITDKSIVLIDDVLYSGRTVRAALDAITALGRPKAVRLAVLIDRGHRELPIRADFVGKNLPTADQERIQVYLQEIDEIDEVQVQS